MDLLLLVLLFVAPAHSWLVRVLLTIMILGLIHKAMMLFSILLSSHQRIGALAALKAPSGSLDSVFVMCSCPTLHSQQTVWSTCRPLQVNCLQKSRSRLTRYIMFIQFRLVVLLRMWIFVLDPASVFSIFKILLQFALIV